MKKLVQLLSLTLFSVCVNAQSGIYEQLKIAVDADSRTLTGVFKLHEIKPNGKVDKCEFFIVATHGENNQPFMANLYSLDYQLLGYAKMAYSAASESYRLKLDKNIDFCKQMFPELVGNGIDFYKKYSTNWQAIRLVKAPKAYFYTQPNEASKGKGYIIKGDWVGITQQKYGWVAIEYINPTTQKVTSAWLKKSDLMAD